MVLTSVGVKGDSESIVLDGIDWLAICAAAGEGQRRTSEISTAYLNALFRDSVTYFACLRSVVSELLAVPFIRLCDFV